MRDVEDYEKRIFKEKYGIDYRKQKEYAHIVIRTDQENRQESGERIKKAIKEWISRRN